MIPSQPRLRKRRRGCVVFLYLTFFEILPEFLRIAVVFRRIACYHTGKQQSAEFFIRKS